MKTKALSAAQIDALAQRLSETPIMPSASATKAGDTFARLLAARIGSDRAALAFTSIMTADAFEQAEARLTLVLDYGNTEPADEPIPAPVDNPQESLAPAIGKRQAIVDQAQTGALRLRGCSANWMPLASVSRTNGVPMARSVRMVWT